MKRWKIHRCSPRERLLRPELQAELRGLGLMDERARIVAAQIVVEGRREPRHATVIAQRWIELLNAVAPKRQRPDCVFLELCPLCRTSYAFFRSPCGGNAFLGEAWCRACRAPIEDVLQAVKRGAA